MSDIILHHFDASPFAEKIRLVLGLKGVAWRSVQIPMVMPKPDLTVLTGGYRKTPVLQVGADIYCDTQRIAAELDTRFPEPPLHQGGERGLACMLAGWGDVFLFQPGAGLSMGTNPDLPQDVLDDRFAFFDFLDPEALPRQLPQLYGQFRSHLQRLEDCLCDGRDWLLGGSGPSWADIACYSPVWMCRGNIRDGVALLEGLPQLLAWERRVAGLGHGTFEPVDVAEALALARDSQPAAQPECLADAYPQNLAVGQAVTVTPLDYGAVPVAGSLLRLNHREVSITRRDPELGELAVHFPRAGYDVVVT